MLLPESVKRHSVETDRIILTERQGKNNTHTLRTVKEKSFFKKINLKEVQGLSGITMLVPIYLTRTSSLWLGFLPLYMGVNWYIQPLLLYMVKKLKILLIVRHSVLYQC